MFVYNKDCKFIFKFLLEINKSNIDVMSKVDRLNSI